MSFWRRFLGLEEKFRLLEVQPEIPVTQESRDACARLGEHPGFQYLIQQLRRHKAVVKMAFESCEEKDLVRLQEKLKSITWLERFVAHEVKIKAAQKKEVLLSEREQEVLQQSLASVSVVE